jgi:hypothetical protein
MDNVYSISQKVVLHIIDRNLWPIQVLTCKTCGGTSTLWILTGTFRAGVSDGARRSSCCCFSSASRRSCCCSCSLINCSFSWVRDVGVAVLNVGGLFRNENTIVVVMYLHYWCLHIQDTNSTYRYSSNVSLTLSQISLQLIYVFTVTKAMLMYIYNNIRKLNKVQKYK